MAGLPKRRGRTQRISSQVKAHLYGSAVAKRS
jgi:hypothetical protein